MKPDEVKGRQGIEGSGQDREVSGLFVVADICQFVFIPIKGYHPVFTVATLTNFLFIKQRVLHLEVGKRLEPVPDLENPVNGFGGPGRHHEVIACDPVQGCPVQHLQYGLAGADATPLQIEGQFFTRYKWPQDLLRSRAWPDQDGKPYHGSSCYHFENMEHEKPFSVHETRCLPSIYQGASGCQKFRLTSVLSFL